MLTGPELGSAIEAAIKKKGITQKQLADDFGITPPSVQGWIKTGRISKKRFFALLAYFKDDVEAEHWGLSSGEAPTFFSPDYDAIFDQAEAEAGLEAVPGNKLSRKNSSPADLVRAMLESKAGKSLPADARDRLLRAADDSSGAESKAGTVIHADFSRPGLVGDEIRIAHYDVRASLGDGQQVPDFPEALKDLVVSQRHLQELGVTFKDANHLKLMTGWGQSMGATIQHLDPMIVDVSIRDFQGDGIYAFIWQGLFYVKRLQVHDADHYEMISDNPAHKDRIIRMDDTYIQAHVLLVWNARRV